LTNPALAKRTVLLTGATGFLGSHLLKALLSAGYKVVILKRSTSNTWRIASMLNQIISYDIDRVSLTQAFEDQHINSVIHTACHYGRNDDPVHQIVETNLMFGLKLLDTATFFNTDTFVNTDTLSHKNLNEYSLSKNQFLEWLRRRSHKIQVINFKLEHIYGPKDDVKKLVPWVLYQLKENIEEIKLTQGEQKRDFIYVDDVVSAYLKILEKSPILPEFNEFDVGTGESVTVKQFLEQLKASYEMNFRISLTRLAFGKIPYREGELMTVEVNNMPLLGLGWKNETKLEDGLKIVVQDFRKIF